MAHREGRSACSQPSRRIPNKTKRLERLTVALMGEVMARRAGTMASRTYVWVTAATHYKAYFAAPRITASVASKLDKELD